VAGIPLVKVHASTSAVVELNPQKDSYVDLFVPDNNYGSANLTYVWSQAANDRRSLFEWDTSRVSSGVTLINVTLCLYVEASASTSGRTWRTHRITGSWTEVGVTWNNQPAVSVYVDASAPPNSYTGWWNVSVLSIFVTGTNVGFRVMDSVEGDASTSQERSREHPTTGTRPVLKLEFTYEYAYSLNGAYTEDGLFDGPLTVTAHFTNLASASFTLNGPTTVYFGNLVLYFSWPTDGYYRVYYPASATETVWVFIPETTSNLYQFTIRDYAGVVTSQTFLNIYRIINGTQRIVERRNVKDVVSTVPAVLTVSQNYLMILNNTSLEYRFGWFLAAATLTETLTVYSIDFPSTIKLTYQYVRMDASRSENNTLVLMNYQDTLNQTVIVHFYVTDRNGTTVYYDNSTQSQVQFQWPWANSMTDYVVYVNANHTQLGILTFRRALVHMISVESPFDLSYFGTFPGGVPSANIVPIAIILAVATCFSFITVPVGMVAMIFTAAGLRYLGWIQFTSNLATDLELLAVLGGLAILYGLYHAARRS